MINTNFTFQQFAFNAMPVTNFSSIKDLWHETMYRVQTLDFKTLVKSFFILKMMIEQIVKENPISTVLVTFLVMFCLVLFQKLQHLEKSINKSLGNRRPSRAIQRLSQSVITVESDLNLLNDKMSDLQSELNEKFAVLLRAVQTQRASGMVANSRIQALKKKEEDEVEVVSVSSTNDPTYSSQRKKSAVIRHKEKELKYLRAGIKEVLTTNGIRLERGGRTPPGSPSRAFQLKVINDLSHGKKNPTQWATLAKSDVICDGKYFRFTE